MLVEGFVVEGFPVLFKTREFAVIARFPSNKVILNYVEEEVKIEWTAQNVKPKKVVFLPRLVGFV